jgi:cellulose synthase/poly-beta-1,6-N-acetylglucosamine synthase-like glycosyltransferase
MQLLLMTVGLLTLGYLLYTLIELKIGFKKIKNLSNQLELARNDMPKISIILSALDEEKMIAQAVTSLLNLNYPDLEVITINDRSTDTTPQILEKLNQTHANLQVHHIEHLPEGWLGKNHALHFAAARASGEWLLFTDADVLMKPDTLLKTISYALEKNLDHLTIYEHHQRNHFWLRVSLLGNYIAYIMALKPWRIRYSWSKKSLGHGSFNLIKKSAYEQCGGHRAIALECLDDLKLGQLIKQHGFKQDTANGQDYIEREWYASLKEMIAGMQKNCFAFFNYKLFLTLSMCLLTVIFYMWPLLAVFMFDDSIRYINLVNVGLTGLVSAYVAEQFRLKKHYAVFYPIAIGILLYTMMNSVIATYRNKGVIWRGTLYPLKLLRKGAD